MGERGIATIVILLIAAVAGLFLFSAAAAINWRFILALMAMGIVALAFVGVLFFHADFKMVLLAAVVSFGIIFIVEVSLPVIVGAVLVIGAMWHLKMLARKPLLFVGLVGIGLLVMVLGSRMVLMPAGIFP